MILCLDFGASFIKLSVHEKSSLKVIAKKRLKGLAQFGRSQADDTYFDIICEKIKSFTLSFKIDQVLITEEMHGFSLMHDSDQKNIFYSWRMNWEFQKFFSENVPEISEFERRTGLGLRDGYAVWGLLKLKSEIDNSVKIGSISSLILKKLGKWTGCCDISMLHSQGLIDVQTRGYLPEISKYFSRSLPYINDFPNGQFLGEIKLHDRTVPVYGGVGDLIGTLDAAQFHSHQNDLIINSGTGSQLAYLDDLSSNKTIFGNALEKRLGYLSSYSVLSHIPCGRALKFYQKIAQGLFPERSEEQFWEHFNNSDKILSMDDDYFKKIPSFNLGVFESASVSFPGGIKNIKDNHTFVEYIDGLLYSFCLQYKNIIEGLSSSPNRISLTGGVFIRNLIFQDYLEMKFSNISQVNKVENTDPCYGLLLNQIENQPS